MASPANNNSSSSPPIPNRPNPKPRNSEVSDPLRRSFGGNPFPANSRINPPSDLSRRKSFGGRESTRLEFSDKENETKPLPTPKGSKNFMSPTISAVSKINASPRKKVLSDKNEWCRSTDVRGLISEDTTKSHHNARPCVSFSDDIVVGIDAGEKRLEGSHDMTVTNFDESEVHENKGIVYSDPRFRISPRPSVPYTSPEFGDREADTLLPPYHPKRNYLSPRPQFLHYRPNPRIEKRFDEGKQLEELFISESSSSDTELSVEESETCEEQDKNAPLDGGTEAIVDVEQLEAESDEEEMVCESTEETSQVPKQSGFKRFKFLGWFLALAMAYLLVSATFPPPTEFFKDSPFSEFHIPREITEFAKGNNLEQLSEKLWTLTESSLVYLDKLISHLGKGAEEYGQMQFHNLTYTLEDDTVFKPASFEINEEPLQEKIGHLDDGYDNEFEEVGGGEEESSEVVCETSDGDAESNEFDEETEMKPGTDMEAVFVDRNNEEHRESEVKPEDNDDDARGSESQETLETESTKEEEAVSEAIYIKKQDVETAAINVHHQEESEVADAESETQDGFKEIAAETTGDLHPKFQQSEVDDAESESQDGFKEIAADTSDDLHPKLQQSEVTDAESELQEGFSEIAAETSDDLHPKLQQSGSEEVFSDDLHPKLQQSGSEEGFSETTAETSDDLHHKVRSFNKAMIVSFSTVLALLAAVAFLFAKKARHVVAASAPKPSPEAEELSSSHVPVENLTKEKLSSPSLLAEEEVDGRISNSFHKKSSFLSSNRESTEHHSGGGGGKKRRESMASSASEYSVGSFSYGSFTTYEKIPIKSGDREEEMITPVRRSSRIRNKPLGQ